MWPYLRGRTLYVSVEQKKTKENTRCGVNYRVRDFIKCYLEPSRLKIRFSRSLKYLPFFTLEYAILRLEILGRRFRPKFLN